MEIQTFVNNNRILEVPADLEVSYRNHREFLFIVIGIIIYGFIIIATSFKKKYKLYLPSEEKLTFFKKLSNFIIFKFKVINSYY